MNRILTCFIATHANIITSIQSRSPYSLPSIRIERSSTTQSKDWIRSFGNKLSPGNYRRKTTRLVSYYALFKWWLLLSQHPSCFSDSTSLKTLSLYLGALAGGLGCFPFDYEAYPPQSDSYDTNNSIRSLIGVGTLVRALGHSVLYPCYLLHKASPKAISRRTSYLRVWLAFHSNPQLIQTVFNLSWFGPPLRYYRSFILAMGRSLGFGSTAQN